MSHLSLSLLGTFDIRLNQQPITRFRSTNVQGLLIYLVLQADRSFPRDTLATLFWPDEPDSTAKKNLRQTLYQLRQILNDSDDGKRPFLLVTRQTVQFNTASNYTLDVDSFLIGLHDGDLPTSTATYNGELLPGFTCDSLEFEDWLRAERERLHGLALKALERLTTRHLRNGRVEQAEATARRQLTFEPWSETAHQQLMEALALAGNRTAALAQYERCKEILDEELGLPPSPETAALAQRIENNELRPIDPNLIAGRYSLEEEIGRGAMGIVYRGQDNQSGRNVAIKMLDSERVGDNPRLVERFLREGEALRQLDHPNIVKMLAMDERDGHQYLVMDYIEGGDLRQMLGNDPKLPLEQALNIALDLADALTRAHRLDILHRDLKPANVLLDADGLPRLTDFGIARLGRDSELTETGAILGTFSYLSPEGCMGQTLDERADIWSFGVLLYELLTGEKPFIAPNQAAVIAHILNEPLPDIRQSRPDIPDALEDLLYRMLAKNRADRIPSVRLVGAEIESILRETTQDDKEFDGRSPTNQFSPATSAFNTPTPEQQRRTRHNLPLQATPFIGRDAELTELKRLLTDPESRLITIVGPGGMGKTRLSIEAASRLLDSSDTDKMPFPDGIFFVELASTTSMEQMYTAVAAAFGFALEKDIEPAQQIINYLSNKKSLLLLDNYEHLLPAPVNGAQFVTTLIQAVPQVTILATSRQKLNLNSEIIFALEGLAFPEWETVEDALSYSAVQLFVQSAQRTRIEFELTAESLPHVTQICRLTEGMPLGIVLAAAWIDMLSLTEIAEEMQKDIDFLAGEMTDLPPRQRSMRAVFDYSWALLTQKEQAVLAKLSVFRSGFTREAAQKITGATLRDLLALVNKSLVQRDVESGRFSLHELLRQLAAEKLEAAVETDAMLEAHSQHYLLWLADNSEGLQRFVQLETLKKFKPEEKNIESAWLWATDNGRTDLILAALKSLPYYFAVAGREFYGVRFYRQAFLGLPEGDPTFTDTTDELTYTRAKLLNYLQELGFTKDENGQTYQIDIDQLYTYFKARGDTLMEALVCQHLGFRALRGGNIPECLQYFRNQIAIYEQEKEHLRLPISLTLMTMMALFAGQIEEGMKLSQRSIELYNENNNILHKTVMFAFDGFYTLYELNDYEKAKQIYTNMAEVGMALWHEGMSAISTLGGLSLQGFVALIQGQLDEAQQVSQKMQDIVAVRQNPRDEARARSLTSIINATLGRYELVDLESFTLMAADVLGIKLIGIALSTYGLGQIQKTISTLIEVLSIPVTVRWPLIFLEYIPIIASLLADQGKYSQAAELMAMARAHPSSPLGWYEIMELVKKLDARLQAELSPEQLAAARVQGQKMDVGETAASLLEELKSMAA